jgi:hypothetical protein
MQHLGSRCFVSLVSKLFHTTLTSDRAGNMNQVQRWKGILVPRLIIGRDIAKYGVRIACHVCCICGCVYVVEWERGTHHNGEVCSPYRVTYTCKNLSVVYVRRSNSLRLERSFNSVGSSPVSKIFFPVCFCYYVCKMKQATAKE